MGSRMKHWNVIYGSLVWAIGLLTLTWIFANGPNRDDIHMAYGAFCFAVLWYFIGEKS